MTLRVEPEALASAAADLLDGSLQIKKARQYLDDNTKIGGFNAVGPIIAHHERAIESLRGWLSHLNDVVFWSSIGIEDTSKMYQRTDAASAANFDALLPAAARTDPFEVDGRPSGSGDGWTPGGSRYGER
ncbi:hypothetical protein [Dactylosporangium matsuzakiense]|uniref:Uncharacterized protein n=1 Tax=Dactylosporangium matsuzakiense TaxID=53360 RepID=A0A9W6NQ94_9ACTN|nr:hypothetical protein [Dactylosporangium matsuzakiense]GLL05113.1 hypothetical protein GCM10017581_068600 [Dactylosporangium matsuzakiense]